MVCVAAAAIMGTYSHLHGWSVTCLIRSVTTAMLTCAMSGFLNRLAEEGEFVLEIARRLYVRLPVITLMPMRHFREMSVLTISMERRLNAAAGVLQT